MKRLDTTGTVNKFAELLKFRSRRLRISVGIIAAMTFFVGFYISYQQQPTVFINLNWPMVAFIYILVLPVVAIINTLRFKLTAKAFNLDYSFQRSFVITVYSTVANMLPLPGGLLVRMANLKHESNTYANTAAVSLYVSALSAFITLVIAATAYALMHPGFISGVGITGFITGILLTYLLIQKTPLRPVFAGLSGVEIASTLADGIGIYMSFLIIDTMIGIDQSMVLTAASVVGSAISLVPAGLGVREGAAALIATQIAVIPASAFIALALNRVIGLSFFLLLTIPLSIRRSEPIQQRAQ